MEKDKKIIKMYESGMSATDISIDLVVARKTIYRVLKRNNVTLHRDIPNICVMCNKVTKKKLCGTCNTNLRRYRVKKKSVEYLGGKCSCGWEGDLSGFDFHHRNPNEKSFNPSAVTLANMSWEKAKVELDKCDLLCALCHRLEHSNYSKFEEISLTYSGKTFV